MSESPSRGRDDESHLREWLARCLLLGLLPLLGSCASAPRLDAATPSHAIPPADVTRLDQMVRKELGDEPGVSGLRLVQQNPMAFAYRADTADAAERSLDVQYYIWHRDFTGNVLATELIRAAERGVRVRVLFDDMNARDRHDAFVVADQHPNIEVRIFNPFLSRYGALGQMGELVLRGTRLNHRMHNKAWIADNRVAIVGGRNIGDEYFGASEHSNFSDTDLVLVGAVVEQVSSEFDAYWNNPASVPVAAFTGRKPPPEALQKLVQGSLQYEQQAGETPYLATLRDPQKRAELLARRPPPLKVREIRVLADASAKVGTKEKGLRASQVLDGVMQVMRQATREMLIVSPYFVPGKRGANWLAATAQRGLRVAVLTNSLAATDVAAVHVGYARYRRDLLRGGVELYEMKRKAGDDLGRKRISLQGSSQASLHTKAMVIDARWTFVGSMNLDPRSANLNTEMSVLVDSPELAEQLRAQFEQNASPDMSCHTVLDEDRDLVWHDRVDGKERSLEKEPDASAGRRLLSALLRVLPLESQL
jgi:putative cardiolipin synthase